MSSGSVWPVPASFLLLALGFLEIRVQSKLDSTRSLTRKAVRETHNSCFHFGFAITSYNRIALDVNIEIIEKIRWQMPHVDAVLVQIPGELCIA